MFSPILKNDVAHRAPVVSSPFTVAQSPLVVGVASEPGYGEKRNTNSYRLLEVYTPTPDGAVEAVIPVALVANVVKHNSPSGETSQLAVETIHAALRQPSHQPIQPQLVAALHQVRQAIAQESALAQAPAHTDVAVVVAAVLSNTVYLACLGEGRAYLISDGVIHSLLTPARPAADLYLSAAFPAQRSHPALLSPPIQPAQQPLTRMPQQPSASANAAPLRTDQPRTYQVTLNAGDRLLLCTPGLYRALNEQAIYAAVVNQHPQSAAWQLAMQAHQAKAAASYTALILQPTPTQTAPIGGGHRWRTLYRGVLVVCCLLLVIVQLFAFAKWGNAPLNVGDQMPPTPLITAMTPASPAGEALTTVTPPTAQGALPLPAAALSLVQAATALPTKATPPAAMVVARLWGRLALTTTVSAFTQNFATTFKTAGDALAAARTATASAPLPTATATPTPTKPPTVPPPTPAPTRTRTIRRPTPTRTPAAIQPAPNNFTNAGVKLLEPAEYDTLNDKRPFRWQTNFVLPPGYAYELVFWQQGQDPVKHGKGYAGLTTAAQINASYEHFRIRNGVEGEYRWGVLLVSQEPYQRIKYLGGGRLIYVKQK